MGVTDLELGPFYAAIDLGTNSCRWLVASPLGDGFRVVESSSRAVRLGEGLQASGRLGDAGMARAMEALRACSVRLGRRPVRAVRGVATEACRQASNGGVFIERVWTELRIALDVVSADEEAALALESCGPLLSATCRHVLLFDIGGGSTELAWARLGVGRGPELMATWSLPLGVVTLAERYGAAGSTDAGFEAMVAEARALLTPFEAAHGIAAAVAAGGVQVIGTSGTATTLAGVALGLVRYRRPLVDGSSLSARERGRGGCVVAGVGGGGAGAACLRGAGADGAGLAGLCDLSGDPGGLAGGGDHGGGPWIAGGHAVAADAGGWGAGAGGGGFACAVGGLRWRRRGGHLGRHAGLA